MSESAAPTDWAQRAPPRKAVLGLGLGSAITLFTMYELGDTCRWLAGVGQPSTKPQDLTGSWARLLPAFGHGAVPPLLTLE